MIKITWGEDTIILPREEAEGFIESLEEAGEGFDWEDLDPPAPTPDLVPVLDWTGERERPQFEGANAAVSAALKASSYAPNQHRARTQLPGEENLIAAAKACKRPGWNGNDPMAGRVYGSADQCWLKYCGQRTEFKMADLPNDLAADLAAAFPALGGHP